MNETVIGIFDKIDAAPVAERPALFTGSLPVLADAFRDTGHDAKADFASWLYKVMYTEARRTKIVVRCTHVVREAKVVTGRYRWRDAYDSERQTLNGRTVCRWSATGLQPEGWQVAAGRHRFGPWPKSARSARVFFIRLFLWAEPVRAKLEATGLPGSHDS